MHRESTFEKWMTSYPGHETRLSTKPCKISDRASILTAAHDGHQSSVMDSISILAHEVRNPLSIINLSLDMLRSHPTEKDAAIYLDSISRSSHRINDIIAELLLNRQTRAHQVEKYSMQQLLEEVIEGARDNLRLKNIVLVKKYHTPDRKLLFDKAGMKIALTNIVFNAIESMIPGKGILNLSIKTVYGRYALFIKDNGCGISRDQMQNIFKPYFTSKLNGCGIGLAAAYDILKTNQVRIKVQSLVGKGTSFILLFDDHLCKS